MVTFISVFCCNGVYAFAATSSIVEQYNNLLENNKKLEIKYNDLKEDNDKLKEENERLNIMISQYKMMIDGLDEENRKIKNTLNNDNIGNIEENGDIIKKYLGEFTISHYCTEKYPHNCGNGNGVTASGAIVQAYHTVAVDTSIIPLGTKLYIEGVGYRIAEDTGGNIKGNRLDLAVTTHKEALNLGKKYGIKVWIVE